MGLMDRVKGVAEKAADVSSIGLGKVDELLDDYKTAIDVLGKFGFTVGKFQVELGILPEIRTSITGSIAGIQEDQLKSMAEDHRDNKLVVGILNAFVTARGFYDRVQLKSSSVTADVKLGLPPGISVRFD
jgi:hypothetical protein